MQGVETCMPVQYLVLAKPEVPDIFCTLRLSIKITLENINLSNCQVSFQIAITRSAAF
jgi:hypothetical protein